MDQIKNDPISPEISGENSDPGPSFPDFLTSPSRDTETLAVNSADADAEENKDEEEGNAIRKRCVECGGEANYGHHCQCKPSKVIHNECHRKITGKEVKDANDPRYCRQCYPGAFKHISENEDEGENNNPGANFPQMSPIDDEKPKTAVAGQKVSKIGKDEFCKIKKCKGGHGGFKACWKCGARVHPRCYREFGKGNIEHGIYCTACEYEVEQNEARLANARNKMLKCMQTWGLVRLKSSDDTVVFKQKVTLRGTKSVEPDTDALVAVPGTQIRTVTDGLEQQVLEGLKSKVWVENVSNLILLADPNEVGVKVDDSDVEEVELDEIEMINEKAGREDLASKLFGYKEGCRPVVPENWKTGTGDFKVPSALGLIVVDGMVRLHVITRHALKMIPRFHLWVPPPQQLEELKSSYSLQMFLSTFLEQVAAAVNLAASASAENTVIQDAEWCAKRRTRLCKDSWAVFDVLPWHWHFSLTTKPATPFIHVISPTGNEANEYMKVKNNQQTYFSRGGLKKNFILSPPLKRNRRKGLENGAYLNPSPNFPGQGRTISRVCDCLAQREYANDLEKVVGLIPAVHVVQQELIQDWKSIHSSMEKPNSPPLELIFAGERLPGMNKLFPSSIPISGKAEKVDLFFKNADLMFLNGIVSSENNTLVHRCLSCCHDDDMIAHGYASTWAFEELLWRSASSSFRISRSGNTLSTMKSVCDSLISEAIGRDFKPAHLYKGLFPRNSTELCAKSVTFIERQMVAGELSGVFIVTTINRLDGTMKKSDETKGKPLSIYSALIQARKKTDFKRVYKDYFGGKEFFFENQPKKEKEYYNRASSIGKNVAIAVWRVCTNLLGLRSVNCILKLGNCKSSSWKDVGICAWMATNVWHKRPSIQGVRKWGVMSNEALAIRMVTFKEILYYTNLLDKDVCEIVGGALEDIQNILLKAIRTDYYDYDLWASNRESGIRYNGVLLGCLGGERFDRDIFAALRKSADSISSSCWTKNRMAERIDLVLRSVRYAKDFDEIPSTNRKKNVSVGKTLSHPIIIKMGDDMLRDANGDFFQRFTAMDNDHDWKAGKVISIKRKKEVIKNSDEMTYEKDVKALREDLQIADLKKNLEGEEEADKISKVLKPIKKRKEGAERSLSNMWKDKEEEIGSLVLRSLLHEAEMNARSKQSPNEDSEKPCDDEFRKLLTSISMTVLRNILTSSESQEEQEKMEFQEVIRKSVDIVMDNPIKISKVGKNQEPSKDPSDYLNDHDEAISKDIQLASKEISERLAFRLKKQNTKNKAQKKRKGILQEFMEKKKQRKE